MLGGRSADSAALDVSPASASVITYIWGCAGGEENNHDDGDGDDEDEDDGDAGDALFAAAAALCSLCSCCSTVCIQTHPGSIA